MKTQENKGLEFTKREIERLTNEINQIKKSTKVNHDRIFVLQNKIDSLNKKPYTWVNYSYIR